MRTLAEKLKKALKDRELTTLRSAERAIGISHSVISRVLNGDKRISKEIRNKLISLSKEITISDFEKPIRRGAKKKSYSCQKDLTELMERYNKKIPTHADQLREQYLKN